MIGSSRLRTDQNGLSVRHLADLVSLACHDLRTPLATVAGFATTLAHDPGLGEQHARYVGMIEAAAAQLGDIIDELAFVGRIEGERYEPTLVDRDTLDLAHEAARLLGSGRARVGGEGASARVDAEDTVPALAALARAALRHGGLEHVELTAAASNVRIAPVQGEVAPIVLADDLRDLGAAVAVRLLRALGCTVALDGDAVRVTFPSK